MLSPDQIRDFCRRRYARFLRSLVTGESFFPLDVPFGRPKPGDDFGKLNREIKALAEADSGYHLDWMDRKFRLLGEQKIPSRVWFKDETGFLQILGKTREVESFRRNLEITRNECPALLAWLMENPEKMAERSGEWPDLLKVCCYFQTNPKPGLYARELPIAVGTKFIEENEGILDLLLKHLLLPDSESDECSFQERYGLRFDEPLIRFRILDVTLRDKLRLVADDISIPLSVTRQFDWSGLWIIVTENKMNFLTLPSLPNALGIWGGGNAAQLLTTLSWLNNCRVLYWGDVDIHGFHIVSRLRSAFPHLTTTMMDLPTLGDCDKIISKAKTATYQETTCLTSAEREAYEQVKTNQLLLEQEKIPYAYAVERLQGFIKSNPP
jgi:hypothetical protein